MQSIEENTLSLSAHLIIKKDIRILPFWLDYHKRIFTSVQSSFDTIPSSEKEYNQQLIHRFFPVSSSQYSEQNNTHEIQIHISSYHFLLDEPTQHDSLKYAYKYSVSDDAFLSNNIVSFFENISPSFTKDTTPNIEIVFLSSKSLNIYEIKQLVIQKCKTDYIYYLDAYTHSTYDWGQDRVLLQEDNNLLESTVFNTDGHAIFCMKPYNTYLKSLIESKIFEITSRTINAEEYHLHISDEEHTKILNAMPYKKNESEEMREFSEYFETRISNIIGKKVKVFNDDIWIRICRPSSRSSNDYNPCHRDVYLDFYRNIVNIYVPIVGSNENSSLAMQSGSHLWNEQDIVVTKCGAYFKKTDKKYSVDAILRSRIPLNMARPNPNINEFILFSPYLIHGCSSNENTDTTRMSIEIRFIEDNEKGRMQEAEFRQFLEKRIWR